MLKSEVKALLILIDGRRTIKEVAEALGTTYARGSQITKSLIQKGFAKKVDGGIQLSETAHATLLRVVAKRFDVTKLLTDSSEDVAIALLDSHDLQAIQEKTGMTYWTVRRSLNRIMETGAVDDVDGAYTLVDDRELGLFLRLWKDEKQRRLVETYAEVLYFSPTLILKRVPRHKTASGTPTAFSAFPKYGIELRTVYDYYAQPEANLGPEEVLAHALTISTDAVERTECAVFYAKNNVIIDLEKLRRISRRLSSRDTEIELENYVRGMTLSEPRLFLPWNEFAEKARLYGVDPEALKPPPSTEVLSELALRIPKPLDIYILGGEAMRIRGLKMATKDIDIVVEEGETLKNLRTALSSLGYEELNVEMTDSDRRLNPSAIMVKGSSPRLDIFVGKIANTLNLTDSMKLRAIQQSIGNLQVHILSNEDLFLLKSVTEREGDVQDMMQLARATGFNWGTVMKEMTAQEEKADKQLCMTLLEGVEAVQDRTGVKTPILHQLERHVLDHTILELARSGKASNLSEIKKYIDYPDYRIRTSIKRLTDKGILPKKARACARQRLNTRIIH